MTFPLTFLVLALTIASLSAQPPLARVLVWGTSIGGEKTGGITPKQPGAWARVAQSILTNAAAVLAGTAAEQ